MLDYSGGPDGIARVHIKESSRQENQSKKKRGDHGSRGSETEM